MESTRENAIELNEIGWWSNWAKVQWLTKSAYMILSAEFNGEYFFNRGGFTTISRSAERSLGLMEEEFSKHGLTPHIFIIQSKGGNGKMIRTLAERGYRIADQMSVMELGKGTGTARASRVNSNVSIGVPISDDELGDWAKTYLLSFYGESSLLPTVTPIVERVAKMGETSLILAKLGGRPVGVLALYRSDGLCGVYCVGTHPDFRGKHVAMTMLEHARKIAEQEGRRLILQTILSDSIEYLYVKFGFERSYLKDLFVKRKGGTSS